MKNLIFTLVFAVSAVIPTLSMAESCTYEALEAAKSRAAQMNCQTIDLAFRENEEIANSFDVQLMCSSKKFMQFAIKTDGSDDCKVLEIKKVKFKAN